jgi:hypothetical protein
VRPRDAERESSSTSRRSEASATSTSTTSSRWVRLLTVPASHRRPDEVAWKTAIDAAPWLLGGTKPEAEVPAEELFEKLKPFKDLVEHDIEDEER